MPSLTMKWHFSQFRTKLVSSHRLSILSKWERQDEKESPRLMKLSMKTSMFLIHCLWKYGPHASIEMLPRSITYTKRHTSVGKHPIRASEGGILLLHSKDGIRYFPDCSSLRQHILEYYLDIPEKWFDIGANECGGKDSDSAMQTQMSSTRFTGMLEEKFSDRRISLNGSAERAILGKYGVE
ncbi:hypothetical protein Tco_0630348 [Tanacetum coccineum]